MVAGNILILGKITDRLIFCERHFPLVRIFLLHNYFKQRRFAGTIDADNRCFFIFFNMKTYIF